MTSMSVTKCGENFEILVTILALSQQHPRSFYISLDSKMSPTSKLSHQHPQIASNFKSLTSRSPRTWAQRYLAVIVMLMTSLCWWCYIGDVMLVTDFRCWWQNHYVGNFFRYVCDFLNVLNRSPTSWIGHQHLKLITNTFDLHHRSPTSVINIDVTGPARTRTDEYS